MKLTINLATRNRGELLRQTIERTLPNIRDKNTTFLVSLDDDDDLGFIAARQFGDQVKLSIKPAEDTLGEKYNRVSEAPADLYLMMVDYAPIVTPGFDVKLLEAAARFPDNIGCVYNHLVNYSFPSAMAMTHRMVELQGFFMPPYFPFWFIDHWTDEVAKMINRISFTDTVVDHLKRQSGTTGLHDLAFWGAFFDVTRVVRYAIAKRIIEAEDFQEPRWRKDLLQQNWPMTEPGMALLNSYCRQNAKQVEQARSVDIEPRHIRAKKRAGQLLKDLLAVNATLTTA